MSEIDIETMRQRTPVYEWEYDPLTECVTELGHTVCQLTNSFVKANEYNGAFIAAAPALVRSLLDEIEALRERVAELEAENEVARKDSMKWEIRARFPDTPTADDWRDDYTRGTV